MPLFHFDVIDSKETPGGPLDVDLPDVAEARKQAIGLLAALAHEALPDGNMHDFRATVSTVEGKPVFEAVLSLRARWLIPE